jgi:hypothetical protein
MGIPIVLVISVMNVAVFNYERGVWQREIGNGKLYKLRMGRR